MEITTPTPGDDMTATPTQGIKTVLHPVADLAAAKPIYAALLGGGRLVATVTDADGNVLGLLQDR
jgi:hypothetical protein